MIAPSHPILSIRGRINEQGVNRYFKLRGLGGFTKENFDLDSLDEETNWLTSVKVNCMSEFCLFLFCNTKISEISDMAKS